MDAGIRSSYITCRLFCVVSCASVSPSAAREKNDLGVEVLLLVGGNCRILRARRCQCVCALFGGKFCWLEKCAGKDSPNECLRGSPAFCSLKRCVDC